ncbi:putative adaptin ear-binding coat-associated protein 2 protein [Phaeoacremonium minimum UCRPA7]|uniref:Putative adaptin ear-binding coat-associated protein 2 protein n=1 Tax=Phaeoacremonium minimum (strain UCR-PA7) TaxID=1286976 RepID=R8BQ43_PHAM7|nr:putative adaptin ear-binding coat-associated protein 2 protein [Phaeoacremonium minimum UCRPA7]EOO01400.1 putative adaptin ear-binding coat-associated protein 2 protein [Phaeoacremonium minimum UCRPA7]
MESIDPATGRQLPSDAIQRILFIATSVHVYNIPPLASTKGYNAGTWTEDPKRHIFTVRLRVIETAIPQQSGEDKVKADIVLEDPSSGQLFAAAPYTTQAVVEPTLDSSRFFALRVQDPSGRKATLGIGFEERSEAFDFSVALQETRKALGWEGSAPVGGAAASGPAAKKEKPEEKKDYSLKEGETITVNLGSKFGRRNRPQESSSTAEPASLSSFSLPPPPSASSSRGGFSLPPPPSAQEKRKSVKDMGFDDGQFGEFA